MLNSMCRAGNSKDRFSTTEMGIGTTTRSIRDDGDDEGSRQVVGELRNCFRCSSKERRSNIGVANDFDAFCKVHQSDKLIIRFRNGIFDDASPLLFSEIGREDMEE